MNNDMAVSGVKYSLCALISTLTTVMSFLSWLLSSILMSINQLTSSDKKQIWTCTQSKLWSRTKPGYVRSLSYDPVNVWLRIR